MRRLTGALIFFLAFASASAQSRELDPTTFVVVGEGLAAGLVHFSLSSEYQTRSFPAWIARQMGTVFPQPLMQPPGLGKVIGFAELPMRVPSAPQTTVRESPPNLFVFNLSVPGYKLSDTLHRRPVAPLVQPEDPQQTAANLVLGFPALVLSPDVPLWTQLEYAQQMQPTLVLVEIGYAEAAEAAVLRSPALLPSSSSFRTDYGRLLRELKATFAEVVVLTIPDPLDSSYFSSLDSATRLLGLSQADLERHGLAPDDLILQPALMQWAHDRLRDPNAKLSADGILGRQAAAEIRSRIEGLNTEIQSLTRQYDCVVYDLHAYWRKLRQQGVLLGGRRLNGDLFGGFYSLNGLYPGPVGHGLIANEVIDLFNRTYGRSFRSVDTAALVEQDIGAQVEFVPRANSGALRAPTGRR